MKNYLPALLLSVCLVMTVLKTSVAVAEPVEGEEPVLAAAPAELTKENRQKADRFGKDVERGKLRKKTHVALDAMIRLAAFKLKKDGHKKESDKLLREWSEQISPLFLNSRYVGEFKPVSQWLSEKYLMLEFILGKEVMYNLRLSDIHSINHEIPVVFWCEGNVDLSNWSLHFTHDEETLKRGLLPLTSWWVSWSACVGVSMGLGAPTYLCAMAASGVEWFVRNAVSPRLEVPFWERVCG